MVDDVFDLEGDDDAGKGYRNPPKSARFRKGESGNPAGRPKGILGRRHRPRGDRLNSLMLGEAYRPIKVSENGKEVTMPMAQAVFRSLAAAAAKGETRAQAMFLKMVSAGEDAQAAYEQMLAEEHERQAVDEADDVPSRIEVHAVEAVDGRPTSRRELISVEDIDPQLSGPGRRRTGRGTA